MKKLLASLMCFILILSAAALPISAQEAGAQASALVELSDDERSAVALFEALDIADLSRIDDETPVTRAEYAHALARLMNSTANYGTSNVYFTDAREDAYINSLAAAGIFAGDGAGNFEPDAYISVRDILTTAFRATGFMVYVEGRGKSDPTYASVAYKIGISHPSDLSATISYVDMLCMLYDIAFSDVYEFERLTDGISYYHENAGKSLIGIYQGILKTDGQVTANRFTSLYDENGACAENEIVIDNTTYIAGDPDTMYKHIGQLVDAYYTYDKESQTKTIVCMVERANDTDAIVVESNNIIGLSGKNFGYYNEAGKRQEIDFSRVASVIYNGKIIVENYAELMKPDSGDVTFYKGENGEYEVAVIRSFVHAKSVWIDASTEVIHTDAEGYLASISAGYFSEGYVKIRGTQSDGVYINANSIVEGTRLAIMASLDEEVVEMYVCSGTETGVVESLDTDKGAITINGNTYRLAKNCRIANGIDAGGFATISLNPMGEVAFCDAAENQVYDGATIGYVWAVGYRETLGGGTATAKIFNELGEQIEPEFAQKVTVDGVRMTNIQAAKKFFNITTGKLERQLVRYSVNGEGKLSMIDLAAPDKASAESVETLYTMAAPQDMKYDSEQFMFGQKYPVYSSSTQGTNVIIIPSPSNEYPDYSDFAVRQYANNDLFGRYEDALYNVGIYSTDPDSPIAEIILYNLEDSKHDNINTTVWEMMVKDVVRTIGGNGELYYTITGYNNGLIQVLNASSDTEFKFNGATRNMSQLKVGDVVRYTMKANGMLKTMTLVYSPSTGEKISGKQLYNVKSIWRNPTSTKESFVSYVNELAEGETADGKTITKYSIIKESMIKFMIYDPSRADDPVYIGTLSDIKDASVDGRGDVGFNNAPTYYYERSFYIFR